ncbi:MAG: hypothetical protein KC468_28340 [Myxococcales bacterium]|nr:hypothetical protein [Myxococcales bacterium]
MLGLRAELGLLEPKSLFTLASLTLGLLLREAGRLLGSLALRLLASLALGRLASLALRLFPGSLRGFLVSDARVLEAAKLIERDEC